MMFTRWRHINLQFKLMSIYPDRPTEQSLSEFAAAVNQVSSAGTTQAATTDAGVFFKPAPPPKYEDLEQPPKYEDIGTPAVLTVETETRAQTTQPDCQNAEGGAASTSASAANK